MSTPKITAMMLVRDRADLLEPAARSVLAQTERDLELVILDDGSTDGTWAVAEAIAASDERVRLLRNEHSLGIPLARNQVLDAARGEYLATCDSDDLARPHRFAEQRAILDGHPEVVGVGARINAFRGSDTHRGHEPDWNWALRDGRLPFPFCTAMLRTEAVRAVGGFDPRYAVAEDLHLAYRLAGAGGDFATTDTIGVDYRLHAGAVTASRAVQREWCTLRAQLRGALEIRLSPRGYAVIVQSALRVALAALRLRG